MKERADIGKIRNDARMGKEHGYKMGKKYEDKLLKALKDRLGTHRLSWCTFAGQKSSGL